MNLGPAEQLPRQYETEDYKQLFIIFWKICDCKCMLQNRREAATFSEHNLIIKKKQKRETSVLKQFKTSLGTK
jgi:hypothetical protein